MTTLPDGHDSRAMSASHGSVEAMSRRLSRLSGAFRTNITAPDDKVRATELFSDRIPHRRAAHCQVQRIVNRPVRVMKFGGTSVGDASCIARVIDIVRAASRESDLVVVVSAMSGVTNKLIEAALQAEAGSHAAAAAIMKELRTQHEVAAGALITSAAELDIVLQRIDSVLREGDDLCRGTSLTCELTLRARDAISSLGERMSALLVAAALAEHGVLNEAIEATELVVTNSCFGSAEPRMDLSREHCETRVRPLLRKGVIPVVTGFIGATMDGELTTLGRGGSDYSATILGAALHADEVIIWTDVDGMHTSDPRLVPEACCIPEISYCEAAELAHFGAKVLHPKTLRPLMQTDTTLWIRNTFAPERLGTKITPEGSSNNGGVKALAACSDAALIKVGGPAMAGVPNVLARTFTATAAARAEVLLILQSTSQNEVRFVVPSARAKDTVETLRREFAHNLADETGDHITLDTTIGIVTVVGQNMRQPSSVIGRTFNALDRENVNIIAIAQGSSECNVSFVVERKNLKTALISTHREFQLDAIDKEELPTNL
jgi:aspartokinase/homoserine dehydrogenase 1